mmetsp:Transcript_6273/g.23118  ORF Transcript_6273/g.23118 Transcript_6273/m.23118 type:complete len:557 (+) Transcript_6273:1145-2815(+)
MQEACKEGAILTQYNWSDGVMLLYEVRPSSGRSYQAIALALVGVDGGSPCIHVGMLLPTIRLPASSRGRDVKLEPDSLLDTFPCRLRQKLQQHFIGEVVRTRVTCPKCGLRAETGALDGKGHSGWRCTRCTSTLYGWRLRVGVEDLLPRMTRDDDTSVSGSPLGGSVQKQPAPVNATAHVPFRLRHPFRSVVELEAFAGRVANFVRDEQAQVVLFLGAGCSFGAGIPGASAITDELVGKDSSLAGLSFAEAIGEYFPSQRMRDIYFKRICGQKRPQLPHQQLAALRRKYPRSFRLCITTNFDTLVEDAFDSVQDVRVCASPAGSLPLHDEGSYHLLKVHGSLREGTLNIPRETEGLQVNQQGITLPLQQLCDESPQAPLLVICGWAGNDVGVCRWLEKLPLQNSVYWCSDTGTVGAMVTPWLAKVEAQVVRELRFEALMQSLAEKLLEAGERPQAKGPVQTGRVFEVTQDKIDKKRNPPTTSAQYRRHGQPQPSPARRGRGCSPCHVVHAQPRRTKYGTAPMQRCSSVQRTLAGFRRRLPRALGLLACPARSMAIV